MRKKESKKERKKVKEREIERGSRKTVIEETGFVYDIL